MNKTLCCGLLGVALCLPSLAAPAAPAAAETPRSVTVSGSGEVSGTPDRARLSMSVEVTQARLKDAQDQANRAVREFLTQARALGARDGDLDTSALSIRAEYDYVNSAGGSSRKFVGYHVSRGVQVTVHDLDKIGDFLKKATDAGINNISDPVLESSKAEDLKQQALAKAALDARAKAQLLADTLGVKLGAVRMLDASSTDTGTPGPPRPMVAMARTAAPSGNEEMGFAAGQLHYSASLTAQFDLIAR